MPFTAIDDDAETLVSVLDAEDSGAYSCIDCGGALSVVSEYDREYGDGSITTVVRHFRHTSTACTGGSGGDGGGESQFHRRRKHDILVAAVNQFDCVEYGTENSPDVDTVIGGYQADAIVVFDEPDPRHGRGLALEFQHKNESKDIDAVTDAYLENKFTAVWVWEDQVDDSGQIPDVDLFGGRVETPWPTQLPDHIHETPASHLEDAQESWQRAYDMGVVERGVAATLPPDWVDDVSTTVWRNQSWDAIFHPQPRHSDHDSSSYLARQFADEIAVTGTSASQVTLPGEYLEDAAGRWFRQTDWQQLFERPSAPVNHDPMTEYIEDRCRHIADTGEGWSMAAEIPFLEWVAYEDTPTRTTFGAELQASVQNARQQSREDSPILARDRVISVVEKNTGRMQPDSVRIGRIKQVLSPVSSSWQRSGKTAYQPATVEHAVAELVDEGRLEITDDGDRVRLVD